MHFASPAEMVESHPPGQWVCRRNSLSIPKTLAYSKGLQTSFADFRLHLSPGHIGSNSGHLYILNQSFDANGSRQKRRKRRSEEEGEKMEKKESEEGDEGEEERMKFRI